MRPVGLLAVALLLVGSTGCRDLDDGVQTIEAIEAARARTLETGGIAASYVVRPVLAQPETVTGGGPIPDATPPTTLSVEASSVDAASSFEMLFGEAAPAFPVVIDPARGAATIATPAPPPGAVLATVIGSQQALLTTSLADGNPVSDTDRALVGKAIEQISAARDALDDPTDLVAVRDLFVQHLDTLAQTNDYLPTEATGQVSELRERLATLDPAVLASGDPTVLADAFGGNRLPESQTFVIFDGTLAVARRAAPGPDGRTWVSVDLAELTDVDEDPELAEAIALVYGTLVSSVNPLLIVDLLSGAMVGSAEATGPGTYEVTVSLERFFEKHDLSRSQRRAAEHVLSFLELSGDTLPARVEVGEDGRLRAIQLTIVAKPEPFVELNVEVEMVFESYGKVEATPLPPDNERLSVGGLRDLLTESGVREALGR